MKTLTLIIALACSTAAYAGGLSEEMDVSPIVTGECSETGVNRPVIVPTEDGDIEVAYLPSNVRWCVTPPARNPVFDAAQVGSGQ